ncbi:MAG TPA: carbamoyltransferase HypF, partial [Methylocella sp.]|nr:carbamoyltransferase HypF [Methylocella sp.]
AGCFQPAAMPGGTQAVRQPWRNTFAHLEAATGWERCKQEHSGLELIRYLDAKPLAPLTAMIRHGINAPLSSSCGRLFDSVAAAIGLCREAASYEGQAAIELENCADSQALAAPEAYPVAAGIPAGSTPGLLMMSFSPLWEAILDDLERKTPPGVIAARFHNGLVQAIAAMACQIFDRHGQRLEPAVALSGGCFQNKILLEGVCHALQKLGLRVLTHALVPPNDGGLALGQAAAAAARSIARSSLSQGRKARACV